MEVQASVKVIEKSIGRLNLSQHVLLASLVAQKVKGLPAIQETWVRSLGGEDPLEKGMSTHFSILAWRIPWTEEPGVGHDGVTTTFTFFFFTRGAP